MENFYAFKNYILNEFYNKTKINESEIGFLDLAKVDLMDNILEIEFMLKNDRKQYVFRHDYYRSVGCVLIKGRGETKTENAVYLSWGKS